MIARTGHHFGALHGPAKVSDFLGSLIHQQHDDAALGGTLVNRPDDLFQENGLSRLGRRDNQLTRALAYRRDEVNYAHAFLAATAKVKSFVWIYHHQIGKTRAFTEALRLHAPYGLNSHQPGFAFLSLDLTGDGCSFGKSKATSQIWVDHHFSQSRPIRPVGCSDCKPQFADTFQYSSCCIGHQNVPWAFLQRQMVVKETLVS